MIINQNITESLILANEAVIQFRRQNRYEALGTMRQLIQKLLNIVQSFAPNAEPSAYEFDKESLTIFLSSVMNAQEQQDYVLVADLLELQIIPWLQQVQNTMLENATYEIDEKQAEENISGIRRRDTLLANKLESTLIPKEYIIEITSSGLLTLQVTDKTGVYYFHSNNNPILEGKIFAEYYYSTEHDNYIVFGLGLGYHIKALLALDDGIVIDIIEPDINIICAALYCMDLSWIYNNPRINLHYDPNYTTLSKLLDENSSLIIHNPSLRHISIPETKLALEKFFIKDSGKRNMRIQFKNNFRENVKNCSRYIDEIKHEFNGKNAIIVAAGPSLDKNVELLSSKPKNTVIVAVGTVFIKLLSMNISPDYVIFLDAHPRLYQQIRGIEGYDIPIICASTACKTIAEKYHGEKFLICQYGYEPAEQYAETKGYQLFESGGSVSTIALDMCIRLGCSEIAFIGLDLAYTNNQSHACHTADCHISDEYDKFTVPAIGGGTVLTSRVFLMFKSWIEKRIAKENGKLTIIDATEGGALKNGMSVMSLQRAFEKWHKKNNA